MKPSHQGGMVPIVLIVDDNPALCQVVAWSLQWNGFSPVEMANGLEAVQWMERTAREQIYPALILLDLIMPVMDGRAFLHWVQSSWGSRYPVPAMILWTAGAIDEEVQAFVPTVLKHIVSKPFHVRDLIDQVQKILEQGRST